MGESINLFFDAYFSWLIPTDWESPGYILTALIQAVLIIHVPAVGALIFIWMERKVSGRIQDRLGPTRVASSAGCKRWRMV